MFVELISQFTIRARFRGLERLLLLAKPMLRLRRKSYVLYNNIRFHIDPDSALQFFNLFNLAGFEIVKVLERFLEPGDVVIDVGSNYGYMAINASRLVGEGGCVLALEPSPEVFDELKANIIANNIHNIQCVPMAASNVCGTAAFNVATRTDLSRLENERLDNSGHVLKRKITVAVGTLDSIVETLFSHRVVRVIKIDTEGHEFKVLQGASQILRKIETIFIVEINIGALAHNNVTFKDIYCLFQDSAYDVFVVNHWNHRLWAGTRVPGLQRIGSPPLPHEFSKMLAAGMDIVAIPKVFAEQGGRRQRARNGF